MPEQTTGHVAGRALLLLAAGLLLYVVLWYLLDRPPTYSCSEPTASELADLGERRADFLLVALPLLAAYGTWLAAAAWRAAAERNARRGKPARPGRVALGFAVVLVPLWALLIGAALAAEEVGASVIYGFLLGAPGLALVGLLALVLVVLLAVAATGRPRWPARVESVSVALLWTGLLSALPYLCLVATTAGRDGTVWC